MLTLAGCYGSKSYEPEVKFSSQAAISEHGREVIQVGRDGITFSNGDFVTKRGESSIRLPIGYHYVNQSSKYVLAASNNSKILVLNKNNGKILKKLKVPFPLVSGAVYADKIIYMLNNDVFGVYSLKDSKQVVEAKIGEAYAIDSRISNPMVLSGGNLMVVPTLDGKLLLLNPKNPKGAQSISIGSASMFNNVIFLSHAGNRIIASTPHMIIGSGPKSHDKFVANIADVVMSGSHIYALTYDGLVLKLTTALKVVAKKKFEFAKFVSLAVIGNKVYALDKGGSLIVMNSSLSSSKVYDVGEVDRYSFVSRNRIYIDERVVTLSKLPL